MDFSLSPEVVEFRDEIRSIVREFVTPEIADRMHTTGVFDAPELNLELGRRGILERACPGLGKGDPIEMYVMFNELEKAGAPYDGLAVALMIAAVVNKLGTDEQKERIIPSIISGEALVCMGYSEADFGSDVASIKTRAVKDGDEWVINGSKMWTTLAQVAEWLILLTRTDLDLPKHKGLTMFILPMNTPGISPNSKPMGGVGHCTTRINHSADGPLKVRPWICTGSNDSRATHWLKPQAAATMRPVPIPPTHIHTPRCGLRKEKYSAAISQMPPMARPAPWPSPVMANKSREAPPATVHQLLMARRNGDKAPDKAD